jgi:NAD(P)H dehydrogenase (quinone)
MADVFIVYDTKTGNTEKAAMEILEGVRESGASAEMKKVDDVTPDDLRGAKAVVLGSPNVYNNYSGKMREFVE